MESAIRKILAALLLAGLIALPGEVLSQAQMSGCLSFDPWATGMTRSEVESFDDFGPYLPVSSTGGLETYNGRFNGEKRQISFVFSGDALYQIQVWIYSGQELEQAIAGFHEAYLYMLQTYGSVHTEGHRAKLPDSLSLAEFRGYIPKSILELETEDGLSSLREKGQITATPRQFRLESPGPDCASVSAALVRVPQLDISYAFLFLRQVR